MKINNKGFTLVELLASVSLIAVLSGVAIAGVTKYQDTTRKKAYRQMEEAIYDSAQSYVQEENIIIPSGGKSIQANTLIERGYLPELQDPKQKGGNCNENSNVFVTKIKGINGNLDQYTYKVHIECADYTHDKTFSS